MTLLIGRIRCWLAKGHAFGRAQQMPYIEGGYAKTCKVCGLVKAVRRRVKS